jgi:hypothetical protein
MSHHMLKFIHFFGQCHFTFSETFPYIYGSNLQGKQIVQYLASADQRFYLPKHLDDPGCSGFEHCRPQKSIATILFVKYSTIAEILLCQ